MQSWETSLDSLRNQAISLKTPARGDDECNGDVSPVFENAAWIARDEGWANCTRVLPSTELGRSAARHVIVATATKLARICWAV
jgi:hypothetical protein